LGSCCYFGEKRVEKKAGHFWPGLGVTVETWDEMKKRKGDKESVA
jgi:hypothetical protein